MVNIKKSLYIIVLPLVLILSSCNKLEDVSSDLRVYIDNTGTTGNGNFLIDPVPEGFVEYGGENPTQISYSITQMDTSSPCFIITHDSGSTLNGVTTQNSTFFLSAYCSSAGQGVYVDINFTIGHQQYYGSIEYKKT